ncbi:hypothetical protein MESS2_310053 [Mesorhizobium metallidurans STM 2683]|uniref:Uncharacterized protein n=1 Tax=Mesorhizobium metallidurans STM 2683 TaxID=1297569 RepID=M5EQQ4_9HYPH|nr:hypothetical protein MESS2_310053 [Mesorhizobium metallidurans STM 2683]
MNETVCRLKIGSVEATLPPWLGRASNWSSQLPRPEDFRMSPITSCALALPATTAAASAEAPERKKRRLVLMDVPDILVAVLVTRCVDLLGDLARTLKLALLTISQPAPHHYDVKEAKVRREAGVNS